MANAPWKCKLCGGWRNHTGALFFSKGGTSREQAEEKSAPIERAERVKDNVDKLSAFKAELDELKRPV